MAFSVSLRKGMAYQKARGGDLTLLYGEEAYIAESQHAVSASALAFAARMGEGPWAGGRTAPFTESERRVGNICA